MPQLAEARCVRRSLRYFSQSPSTTTWPGRSASLRSAAEGVLRDLAFVYQAVRSVREAMMEEGARMESRCR